MYVLPKGIRKWFWRSWVETPLLTRLLQSWPTGQKSEFYPTSLAAAIVIRICNPPRGSRSWLLDAQFNHDEQDFAVAAAEGLPFGRVSGARQRPLDGARRHSRR